MQHTQLDALASAAAASIRRLEQVARDATLPAVTRALAVKKLDAVVRAAVTAQRMAS